MQLNTIKPTHPGKNRKRIGRGGKRGTTSGRGTKGQKSRSGHRIRPAEKDLIKSMPKLRGRGKHSFKTHVKKDFSVNVGRINKAFESGETISPKSLCQKGLVETAGSYIPGVKLLADGEVTKKFFIEDCRFSAAAKAKIEKAGGIIK